ncbi:MAG: hypothetical protein QNJ77_11095 [Acidimicrobiia bacterium]|nr:hypothetical protein [Acidimicrobiia bacterium]
MASIEDVVTSPEPITGGSESPAVIKTDEESVLEFAACMRDLGIDFPDPIVDADGNVGFDLDALGELGQVDEAELENAFEACVALLEGVSFGFERIFEAEFQDDVVIFAGCMRDNGVDMPDPDFAGIMEGRRLFPGWEPELDDPDFEAAFEACEELLPGIPGIAGDTS